MRWLEAFGLESAAQSSRLSASLVGEAEVGVALEPPVGVSFGLGVADEDQPQKISLKGKPLYKQIHRYAWDGTTLPLSSASSRETKS